MYESFLGENTKKKEKVKPEQERTAKRAASRGPGGDDNTPGQHFTFVTSCWPQREERGVARRPAGLSD